MIRAVALSEVAPDETGTRWVVALRGDEVFVCAKHPDGTEIVELKYPPESGRRPQRMMRLPKNLNWQPLGA